MKIKKGDLVFVTTGAQSRKGKSGTVLEINRKLQRVKIDGVGPIKLHIKPRKYKKYPEGGIIMDFAMIHISNVSIVNSVGVK